MAIKGSDALTIRTIEQALESHGLLESAKKIDLEDFRQPLRLGKILDHVRMQTHEKQDRCFKIGPYRLDSHNPILEKNSGVPVKLTEKEAALLTLLAVAEGKTISRKEILSTVWEYAEDAETHTLETHIYRLRQKIEKDPSKPEILVTDGDGYFISTKDHQK